MLSVLLRQRAQEMWNWIYQLESEKFDFIEHMKHQRYEVLLWSHTEMDWNVTVLTDS